MKKLWITAGMLFGLAALADESTTVTTASTTNSPQPSVYSGGMAGKFGVGLIIGEPTGASVKYFLNDTIAVDGALGWSTHDHTDFYTHGDVLWHCFNLIPVQRGRLPVYFGVGALARFRDHGDDNQVGIRAPVGVSYLFDNVPIDIFAEIAPAIDVAPSVRGEVTGGIGARFWF